MKHLRSFAGLVGLLTVASASLTVAEARPRARAATGSTAASAVRRGPTGRAALVIGTMTTWAGNRSGLKLTGEGVPALNAQITKSVGVAVDPFGNVFYSEGYSRVRKISRAGAKAGVVTTFAGKGTPGSLTDPIQVGFTGDTGPAGQALLSLPLGLAADALGSVYIADFHNSRVRKVDYATGTIDTFAGGGPPVAGFGDGGQARSAYLGAPSSVATDSAGNVYIGAYVGRTQIRKVTPDGTITTLAGKVFPSPLGAPCGLAVDSHGNVYVCDLTLAVVHKVGPAGVVTVYAGTFGLGGDSGDGGAATAARIAPEGIALDSHDNLYILGPSRVRRVDAVSHIINTVAGSSFAGYDGDGQPATAAHLFVGAGGQAGLAFDAQDNMYIGDAGNGALRRVVPGPPLNLGGSALVMISGLGTSSHFADPGVARAGTCLAVDKGGWQQMAHALSAFGDVFVIGTRHGRATPSCPGVKHNLGSSEFELTTTDEPDIETVGNSLLVFLSALHTKYGVDSVWLVGHSYGGLWARATLSRLARASHPAVEVEGVITVGTPHTGSFGADAATGAAGLCGIRHLGALALCASARAYLAAQPSVRGLTSSAVTAFNARQTTVLSNGCGVPLFTLAGNAFPFGAGPVGRYFLPNDGIVGIGSALGEGARISSAHVAGTFPMVHSSIFTHLVSLPVETEASQVLSTIAFLADHTRSCPAPRGAAGQDGRVNLSHLAVSAPRPFTVRLVAARRVTTSGTALVSPPTSVIHLPVTTISCGANVVPALPLLDSSLTVSSLAACHEPVTVANGGAGLVGLAPSLRATVRVTLRKRTVTLELTALPGSSAAARITGSKRVFVLRPGKPRSLPFRRKRGTLRLVGSAVGGFTLTGQIVLRR